MANSTSKKRPPVRKKRYGKNKTAAIAVAVVCIVLIVAIVAAYLYLGPAYAIFDYNYDGASVLYQRISLSTGVSFPSNCVRDGYTFDGWYLDSACTLPAEENIVTLIFGDTYYAKWVKDSTDDNDGTDVVANGDLSVHFLELGNKYTGDCVYIKAGDVDILIDAGSKNDSGSTITSYLNNYVTDGTLEYVIATHAHEDHISGFYGENGVFANFKTETIIEFALTNKTSTSTSTVYGKYVAARKNEVSEGAVCYTAAQCFDEADGAQRVYQLTDDISLEILYSYYYYNTQSSGENDYSVCVMIHQGDNNYLFTGDLEKQGEEKMVEYYESIDDPLPHCVLYKAGHHGSKTSSSETLMAAITPEYVCVCCCCGTAEYTDNNSNQFPTQQFINNVAPYTDKVYVTTIVDNYVEKSKWSDEGTVQSMNGNIVFSCTDGVVSIHCSNNDLILKETDWFKQNRTCPEAWQ